MPPPIFSYKVKVKIAAAFSSWRLAAAVFRWCLESLCHQNNLGWRQRDSMWSHHRALLNMDRAVVDSAPAHASSGSRHPCSGMRSSANRLTHRLHVMHKKRSDQILKYVKDTAEQPSSLNNVRKLHERTSRSGVTSGQQSNFPACNPKSHLVNSHFRLPFAT